VSEGRLARPNRVTPARVRAEIDALAAAGDIAALRRLGQSLPPLLAFTYERRRAAALALALEGNLDAALSEHALGRAAGTLPDTVAADAALLRSLARGEPSAGTPAFDLRPLYGVAAVAATIALTVGVTLRLVAVDPSLPALEAPPDRADTVVRVDRPAPQRPDDRAPARPRPASAPSTAAVFVATQTLPEAERLRAQPRSGPARSTPKPGSTRPRPTPPPAQPTPAPPPPTAAPAPAEPVAETPPVQQAAAPAPPAPEAPRKPGRRRGHEKQAKKPAAPESLAVVAAKQLPAPAEQPQPAADQGQGPPEHANNDKDKEPKEKPEKEK
jgi:hypothetical protein